MTRIMISDIPCPECECDEVYFHHDNDCWQCCKCDATVPFTDPNDAAGKKKNETLVPVLA